MIYDATTDMSGNKRGVHYFIMAGYSQIVWVVSVIIFLASMRML